MLSYLDMIKIIYIYKFELFLELFHHVFTFLNKFLNKKF